MAGPNLASTALENVPLADVIAQTAPGGSVVQSEQIEGMEPSLFESYQNIELTYRGLTAPFSTLVKLCPVPHEQWTSEKREEWTAKILHESGVEDPRIDKVMKAIEVEEQRPQPQAQDAEPQSSKKK